MKKILIFSKKNPYGPELVVNGDFSNGSTGWTLPAGWAIVNEAAVDTTATLALSQRVPMVSGTTYKITFDISNLSSGTPSFKIQFVVVQALSSAQSYDLEYTATSTGDLYVDFIGGGAQFTVDNVSIKEIL